MATDPSHHLAPPVTTVDAAIATVDVPFDHRILDMDVPAIYETGPVRIGRTTILAPVQKRGAASGLTEGLIVSMNPDIEVDYGYGSDHDYGRFPSANLFRVAGVDRPFARQGDSGALVVARAPGRIRTTRPVLGMVFSVDGVGNVASACMIGPVFEALDLATLCTGAARVLLGQAMARR